jgi:hypothetical protein
MKIIYTPNPLQTQVLLDENEKLQLWLKIKIAWLEDTLFKVNFYLNESGTGWFSIAEAKKEANPEYYLATDDKPAPLDKHIDEQFVHYVRVLEGEAHDGDCTSSATTCIKCAAEKLLGFDTIPGLGAHQGRNIADAFSDGATIDEAITRLENYKPMKVSNWASLTAAQFDEYSPRWIADAKEAAAWLKNYKETRLQTELVEAVELLEPIEPTWDTL